LYIQSEVSANSDVFEEWYIVSDNVLKLILDTLFVLLLSHIFVGRFSLTTRYILHYKFILKHKL